MKVYVDLSDSDLRTIFHALTIGSNNCNSTCMHKDCKNCWFKKGVDSLRKKFTNPQSLADYTKQVRKEVVQEIKQEVEKVILSKDLNLFGYKTLCKILDQIQE